MDQGGKCYIHRLLIICVIYFLCLVVVASRTVWNVLKDVVCPLPEALSSVEAKCCDLSLFSP